MYNGLLHAHSGLRYVVIILMIAVLIKSYIKWQKGFKFEASDKRLSLISISFLNGQLLIGTLLYFMSPKVFFDAATMKSSLLRFFTLEHPLMMLIAVVIINLGHIRAKTYTNYESHRKLFFHYLMGLFLIIVSIPWPFRSLLGAAWF